MRPGQLTPNDFELAILRRILSKEPSIAAEVDRVHVLSREFTGVGSFTKFQCNAAGTNSPDRRLGLDDLINRPSVPNGMGAVLFCKGGKPECLEVVHFRR